MTSDASLCTPFRTLVVLVGLASCAGCSPTAPSCDPRAVTGPTELAVSCVPAGSDLQCQAIANANGELYVCGAIPNQDVTTQAVWTSSDATVAMVTAAGFFKVLTAGQTQVTATWHYLSQNPIAFTVAPGATPARLTNFVVVAQNAGTTVPIPGVSVDQVPDQGAAQSCVTNSVGSCGPLWVPTTTVSVTGSKIGYLVA